MLHAGAGMTVTEDGRRVSSRIHRKPLEWYRNEHVEYTRQHKSELQGMMSAVGLVLVMVVCTSV